MHVALEVRRHLKDVQARLPDHGAFFSEDYSKSVSVAFAPKGSHVR